MGEEKRPTGTTQTDGPAAENVLLAFSPFHTSAAMGWK